MNRGNVALEQILKSIVSLHLNIIFSHFLIILHLFIYVYHIFIFYDANMTIKYKQSYLVHVVAEYSEM